jgi:putative protease
VRPPELLAPAGSPEALDAAIGEGADAVYLGLKSFNARMRSANFAYSQFEGALRSLHRMGRRLYVTVNTVFEQREADRIYQLLKYLAALGPDGIIVQDFGVLQMVRDHFPGLKLHASTQMNIASARGCNLLSKRGISRVVLARELRLDEIRSIRARTNSELEVFVHGALCVSASGLCLFSSFLGGKSANRGMCTQACRRMYMRDDGTGGYYFSPGDLRLLERIPLLIDAGVNAFKIEGRMKSADYVGAVVSAYRRVIDGFLEGGGREGVLQEGMALLDRDFARKKTVFYFDDPPPEDTGGKSGPARVEWLNSGQDGGTGINLGPILRVRGGGENRRGLIARGALPPAGPGPARPAEQAPLNAGDTVRFHRADDSARLSHKLRAAPEADAGSGKAGKTAGWWISLPEGFGPGDSVYLIQTREMSRRYPPVIPKNSDSLRRTPGRDRAPEINLESPGKAGLRLFPEGIYGAVSRIEDLYVLQSVRPVRVMLGYSRKTAARLLDPDRKPLPFSPGEIILTLDPYFPQGMEPVLEEEIPRLRDLGYDQFVLNNPGHFSYFRNDAAALIAGPYLYAFNRWAAAFVSSLGVDHMIPAPENNRQNLERTISPGRRPLCFITLFAYPALFRIRADLGATYDFDTFRDTRGETFRLIHDGGSGGGNSGGETDGSLVIPERPFSIVDKVPFLREAGFSRFILDFSGPPLKKKDYRDIMAALETASPLPRTVRFNWKNGFYSEERPRLSE